MRTSCGLRGRPGPVSVASDAAGGGDGGAGDGPPGRARARGGDRQAVAPGDRPGHAVRALRRGALERRRRPDPAAQDRRGDGPLQARPGDDVRRQGQRRHRRAAEPLEADHGALRRRRASRSSPRVGNHDRKAPPGAPPGTAGAAHPRRAGRPGQLQAACSPTAPTRSATPRPTSRTGFTQRARDRRRPAGRLVALLRGLQGPPGDLPGQLVLGPDRLRRQPEPGLPRRAGQRRPARLPAPQRRRRHAARASRCSWSCTCPRATRATRATSTPPRSTT